MRALIFGANGFVGGHLARELTTHGYTVYGADRQDKARYSECDNYYCVDITNAIDVMTLCRKLSPDVIINLAAISSVGASWKLPKQTIELNVCGTINIFEAAKKLCSQPKILIIGSSEEYSPSDAPLKETDPIDATNPYGISKMTQEHFAQMYTKRYGLKIYLTRSFNHIGPGQSPTFVVSSWCKQVAEIDASGKPGIVSVGNLEVSRDFTDVRDIVRAYRLLIESDYSGEIFNIGSGIARPLKKILSTITKFSSQPMKISVNPALLRPSDNPTICCDATKAQKKLGWEPRIPFKDTLYDTYKTFQDRF
jgi:GDP-4-dehydro-6-deoxy-D-mannose reductase